MRPLCQLAAVAASPIFADSSGRFTGTDADANIAAKRPEFTAWKWGDPAHLPDMIVPFKRDMYRAIVAGFGERLGLSRRD